MTTSNAALLKAVTNMTTHSHSLQTEVTKLSKELSALSNYSQRSRIFIRLMIGIVIALACLSLTIGFLVFENRSIARTAERASSATTVSCVSANQNAKTEKEFWSRIFLLPPPLVETAPEKAQRLRSRAKAETYINEAYVQRDCSREGGQ